MFFINEKEISEEKKTEINETVNKIILLDYNERRFLLDKLSDKVCLLCGKDQECYCDPMYDE